MIRKSKIKVHRLLVIPAILLVVLLSVLLWNRNVLLHGYEDRNAFAEFMPERKETGLIYSWSDPEGIYIKELILAGSVQEDANFSIEVTYLNSFGKTKTEKLADRLNAWASLHTTYLNKKVTGLRIIIPAQAEAEITQIQFTNHFEWYLNRMLAVALTCLFSYLLLAEQGVRERPALFFAAFSLCFGLLFIRIEGPAHTIWDEEIHFVNTYRLAGGDPLEWNGAAQDVADYINLNRYNTRIDDAQLQEHLNTRAQETLRTEENRNSILSFQQIGYLPQALFLKAGMLLGLKFTWQYALGKFGSLLIYILVMSLAIHFAGEKRFWLAFLAMCPTLLFTAASYSYDTVCFGFITLGTVLLFRLLRTGGTGNGMELAGSVLCLAIGCAAKVIYAPLMLLALIPLFRGKGKQAVLARIFVLALTLLIMSVFVVPTLYNLVVGNTAYLGDYRGGDTGVVRQFQSLIAHPLAGFRIFLSNLFSFDNFRETGGIAPGGNMFPNLLLLNLGYFGVLKDKWSMLLIPAVLYLVFGTDTAPEQASRLKRKEIVFSILVITCGALLIWVAMYLGFTAVGEEQIDGVQARYYLPLLFPLTCVLPSGWLSVRRRVGGRNLIYGLLPVLFAALSCGMMLRG